jgi:mRNA interferase YafQ
MRTIERVASFKKDYKRESKGIHRNSLDDLSGAVLYALVNDQPLDARYILMYPHENV